MNLNILNSQFETLVNKFKDYEVRGFSDDFMPESPFTPKKEGCPLPFQTKNATVGQRKTPVLSEIHFVLSRLIFCKLLYIKTISLKMGLFCPIV
jgi:hypothetical protein|nr:MAG TPA: hypothetical protein [Caudoviricetes sp.]